MDRSTAAFILSLIKEEESKNDQLRKQFSASLKNLTDALDSNESASEEQSFNREQVQEQEQVHYYFLCFFCFVFECILSYRNKNKNRNKRKRKKRKKRR